MIPVPAVSRRELLRRLGLAGAAALVLPEFDRVLAFQRDVKAGATPAGALSASEAATLAAMCARLIPTDENGPGATEARASVYIDRALTGWLAPSREAYSVGLAAVDDAARARGAKRFVDLPPAEQDAVLTVPRRHTVLCTRADAYHTGHVLRSAYGGNANFVGWDLIGYPGVRLNVTAAEQNMSTPATPNRNRPTTTSCSRRETIMATNLKPTDVVIIGMGAAGGVAALPLAQAGIEVVGLEAGTWLTAKDFAPDELRNNFRAWPQAIQKAQHEIPTHRPNASAPNSPRLAIHPMMNAVGGTSLHYWAQSWRLSPWDFKVVSETTRRYGASRHSRGIDRRGLAVRHRRARALLRHRRAGNRRVGQGGEHQRHDRSARQRLRGAAAPRVSDAAAALERVARPDGLRGARPRMASVSRPGRHQHEELRESAGLRVSRLLQPWRLPRERERLDGRHHHPEGAEDRQAGGRDAGARDRSTSTATVASPASPT